MSGVDASDSAVEGAEEQPHAGDTRREEGGTERGDGPPRVHGVLTIGAETRIATITADKNRAATIANPCHVDR